YSSFGKATVTVNQIDNPIRFQGQYFDAESGLHYNHFRYYDPTTGRFISQDPIGLLGGINHYQYAPNHINWVDPLGLSCKENAWNEFQKDHKGVFANSSAAAEAYRELIDGQSPWPIGYIPVQATLLPGTKFQMAMSPGQPSDMPGAFGTFDDIPDVDYVRNKLAVKDEWKKEIDRVVTFEVTQPMPVLLGPVGPQVDNKKYLPGGGTQLQYDKTVIAPDRMKYVKVIDENLIK
ncbi:RHS repeat-associated core domain-containing protein, partial [Alkalimonas amylolytica]